MLLKKYYALLSELPERLNAGRPEQFLDVSDKRKKCHSLVAFMGHHGGE